MIDEGGDRCNCRRVAVRFRADLQPDPQAKVLTDDRTPVNWLRTQPTGMLQRELVHPAPPKHAVPP